MNYDIKYVCCLPCWPLTKSFSNINIIISINYHQKIWISLNKLRGIYATSYLEFLAYYRAVNSRKYIFSVNDFKISLKLWWSTKSLIVIYMLFFSVKVLEIFGQNSFETQTQ